MPIAIHDPGDQRDSAAPDNPLSSADYAVSPPPGVTFLLHGGYAGYYGIMRVDRIKIFA